MRVSTDSCPRAERHWTDEQMQLSAESTISKKVMQKEQTAGELIEDMTASLVMSDQPDSSHLHCRSLPPQLGRQGGGTAPGKGPPAVQQASHLFYTSKAKHLPCTLQLHLPLFYDGLLLFALKLRTPEENQNTKLAEATHHLMMINYQWPG